MTDIRVAARFGAAGGVMRTVAQVVVSLGPLRVDVARLHRGQIAARASAWLDRSTVEQAWECELSTLDATLAQLLRTLGIRSGASAVIEYSHPETTVDVFGVTSGGDAIGEATKLLGEASDIDLGANPCFAVHLGQTNDGASTLHHVLCAADRDGRTDALRQWVLKAGLRPVAYVPIEAAAVQVAARQAVGRGDGAPRVFVHMGEQRTAIVLANQNELRLARCVSIGVASLVDAAAEAQNTTGQIVEAAQRRGGYDVLRRTGVGVSHGRSPRADGSDRLLPYLNPALQRYVVEIRQSLRFGLSPQDAARATLVACGPGSVLPGLCDTLATQLEVAAEPVQAGAPDGSAAIDLGVSLLCEPVTLSLTPVSHKRAGQTRRAVWGVAAGAAAALLIAAGDAALVWRKTRQQHSLAASLAPRYDELSRRADRFATLTELQRQNAEIYRAIRQGLGNQPDWKLVLGELSGATLDDMRLTEISGGAGPGGATVNVRGLVPLGVIQEGGSEASSPMARFLASLSGASVVEAAELGETRTAEVRGIGVELFAADIRLRGIPFTVAGSEGR